MALFRLLFWGLLIYLGFKVAKQVFLTKEHEPLVKGKPKQKPTQIDESQIEDAEFEELDDK